MPSEGKLLIHCYNRGCGQKFDPKDNKPDSCVFHPGEPFFHDAYKGWLCCKKKCTDFTEFLNMKGCTRSYHSNVKPPEPVKPAVDKSKASEVIEERARTQPTPEPLERPSFDTPLTQLQPVISPVLQQQLENIVLSSRTQEDVAEDGAVPLGTNCKNNSCKASYEGPDSDRDSCRYHAGCPVFHEGLKFWLCCQRRTTDFNAFLEQEGCAVGSHVWIKKKTSDEQQQVNCRYDWHQTGGLVVVSVFAKKYDPAESWVKLNPVRLRLHLFFPEDQDCFDLDLELRGVVDVVGSSVSMLPTKVEVNLRKAQLGSWSKLDFPRLVAATQHPATTAPTPQASAQDDLVDLSDL